MRLRIIAAAAVAAHATMSGAVHAAPVDATNALQLLQNFNTIVLGDLSASTETQGTVFVGGDLNSNGYGVAPDTEPQVTLGGSTGGLFVGGDVNGGSVNVGYGANSVIGGSQNAIINSNGGGTVTTGATIPVAEVAATLTELSIYLSTLSTPGGSVDTSNSNSHKIISGPGGSGDLAGLAVLNADGSFFSGNGFGGLTAPAGITAVVNVSGETINFGGAFNANGVIPNLLFNFYEAKTINISTALSFSLLAPQAHINLSGGGVNGTVVAGSMTQSGAEIRTTFGSDLPPPPNVVPLPAAGWLLIAGVAGLAAAGRRRAA